MSVLIAWAGRTVCYILRESQFVTAACAQKGEGCKQPGFVVLLTWITVWPVRLRIYAEPLKPGVACDLILHLDAEQGMITASMRWWQFG